MPTRVWSRHSRLGPHRVPHAATHGLAPSPPPRPALTAPDHLGPLSCGSAISRAFREARHTVGNSGRPRPRGSVLWTSTRVLTAWPSCQSLSLPRRDPGAWTTVCVAGHPRKGAWVVASLGPWQIKMLSTARTGFCANVRFHCSARVQSRQ